jgi:hypothetical protein
LVYHETFFSSKLRTTPSIWPGTQLFDKIEDKPDSVTKNCSDLSLFE